MIVIATADLHRLILEIADGDKLEWLDERGIDGAAMLDLSDRFKQQFFACLVEHEDLELALDGFFGFAFQLGFETCAQFRQTETGP